MKILYLKLKNYATIYTAMNLKEIEIDFTKCKNNVILLVGANGSGKTSIISTLHPFAYYGNMDIRNNNDIICEGKDGYKEIHIQDDGDIYKIQHHYKNSKKGSITVKSFIQKNDEELNPNGNVTSFNEVVKTELSLELDFLRLLRLGSNVTNLIDMKASERKSFASFLLSDIDTYTNLFKKVSEDSRVLRGMIKTVSDRLVKLNVIDQSILETDIKNREAQLSGYLDKKDNLQKELGTVEGQIKTLVPDGIDHMMGSIRELESSIRSNVNDQNRIMNYMNKMCIVLTQDINKEIEFFKSKIDKMENQVSVNDNMILFYTEQLNPLYHKKEDLESKLKECVSDLTYRQMDSLYVELSEKLKDYNHKFKDYTPIYTKDNLINLLEILKQIDSVASEIQGFDARAVKKTVQMLKESINIDSYIYNRNKEIDKEIMKITTDLRSSINPKSPVILFKPENCPESNCPYLYLYDLIFNKDTKSDTVSLSSLETEKDLLNDISNINKNIEYIFMILKSNMSLINKGDISYFKIDSILNSINNGISIYNENYMTDLISDVEEYEEYVELKTKVKELKAELIVLSSNQSNEETIRNDMVQNDNAITEIYNKRYKIEIDNDNLKSDIDSLHEYYDNLCKYKEYKESLISLSIDHDKMKSTLDDKGNTLNTVSGFTSSLKNIRHNIDLVDWEIKKLNDDIFNMKVKMKEFINLSEEQAILNEKFDDISLVRESLSSNKGIPLLYMQLYLKNTKIFVNELLKIVYNDNFELDDFDINENEFNIPYIKNNIRISDVMYASQGEKSFLSLALSFALINQSIKDYNILLLDEIDSTLDTKNRAMFLNILEKQMESISAEQIFLITHNNMFENYPVDVILTSKNTITNFSNANIIFSHN